jgi:hypothetical protein
LAVVQVAEEGVALVTEVTVVVEVAVVRPDFGLNVFTRRILEMVCDKSLLIGAVIVVLWLERETKARGVFLLDVRSAVPVPDGKVESHGNP